MAPRNSQQDQDAVTWQTAGLRLGVTGLDLRLPADPGALVELLNARFVDDRTIRPRYGHVGRLVQDGSDLAPLGDTVQVTDDWIYGHGLQLSSANAAGWENAHHPIAGQARATFNFDGADVVWTGDRLLVMRENDTALGGSTFWNRNTETSAPRKYGIPAYLPLMTDSHPPTSVSGDYIETCLTERYRCYVYTESGGELWAWLLDRETGAVVDKSEISGASLDPVECKIFQSAGYIVAMWRDLTAKQLYINYWTGSQWHGASVVRSDVYAFDIAPVSGGFHLLWREGSPSTDAVYVGKYSGITTQSTPYAFGTVVQTGSSTPGTTSGPVAISIGPTGDIGVLLETTSGLWARVFTRSMVSLAAWTQLSTDTGWSGGIAICSRGLRNVDGVYEWVTHTSRGDDTGVVIQSFTSGGVLDPTNTVRYNSRLASKSFRVGDEVFCWLRSSLVGTHYLLGGVFQPQVCGYADREEAIPRAINDGNYAIPHVLPDPRSAYVFTWTRLYNTGQTYVRGGNVRTGDIDFLPAMTNVQFGQGAYLSGSAVRVFDGVELGDAGFQDYPIISDVLKEATGGHLADGDHYFRVYAVRYTKRGERFQSAAKTYGPVTFSSGGSLNKATLTIKTLPDTNHDDVVFEVYKTEAGGTTFYLDGVVNNSLTAATVTYVCTRVDRSDPLDPGDLIEQRADSHAAGIGQLSELEEWGPLGCAMLAVSGDRVWGAGGQVPPGVVQFSKLHEAGEGAGFDDLAGFQEVDTEGNAITSVARLNDVTVVFERDKLFIIAGTGPDNYGRGAFQIPQIMLSDGAITHFGTASTQLGTVFWGAGGPRLLTTGYQVELISSPVRPLAEKLTPSGCRADLARQEVIWYTEGGDALLWNYQGGSRWARWNGLEVAGCSSSAIVTTDGRLLVEREDAIGDNGQPFQFAFETADLRADQILQGATMLRAIGLVGTYEGRHNLRMKVYYNGSPLWVDKFTWEPAVATWLASVLDVGDLTPTQVDALGNTDQSGGYMTHKRVSRQNCAFFRVRVDNIEADSNTLVPLELSLELGGRGGLARVPVATFE